MMSDNELEEIKQRLEEHEKRIQELESRIGGEEGPPTLRRPKGVDALAGRAGVEETNIREIYDIEPETLTVVQGLGDTARERTQSIALLALVGYKFLFGKDDVLAQEIRRNVADNGVSLTDFAKHMNEISPQLVRRIGKTKSPKTKYRLTTLGEARARQNIRSLSGVEDGG
jgi:hypothetical protein